MTTIITPADQFGRELAEIVIGEIQALVMSIGSTDGKAAKRKAIGDRSGQSIAIAASALAASGASREEVEAWKQSALAAFHGAMRAARSTPHA